MYMYVAETSYNVQCIYMYMYMYVQFRFFSHAKLTSFLAVTVAATF